MKAALLAVAVVLTVAVLTRHWAERQTAPARVVSGCTGIPERLGDLRVLVREHQTSVWLEDNHAVEFFWQDADGYTPSEITPEDGELVLPAGCAQDMRVSLEAP